MKVVVLSNDPSDIITVKWHFKTLDATGSLVLFTIIMANLPIRYPCVVTRCNVINKVVFVYLFRCCEYF